MCSCMSQKCQIGLMHCNKNGSVASSASGDANSTDAFDQPTDIYVAPNGDIFVSQGHGARPTDRILKFSKDGKYIKSWGKRGNDI
jgi:hypothetical protein